MTLVPSHPVLALHRFELNPARGIDLYLGSATPAEGVLTVVLRTSQGETRYALPVHLQGGEGVGMFRTEGPAQEAPLLGAALSWSGPQPILISEADQARLDGLFPSDDRSFKARFMLVKDRWGDVATQAMVMRQICRWYTGHPGYRTSAAIILAYKAVERLVPEELDEAVAWLEQAETWLRGQAPHPDPRANPEHLLQSVLVVTWHLQLLRGDLAAAMRAMARSESSIGRVENVLTPALPASRSLVLLGWMRWRTGDAIGARQAWLLIVELYRRAMRLIVGCPDIHFEELRLLANTAVVAARGVATVDGTASAEWLLDRATVMAQCVRVRDEAGQRLVDVVPA